VSVDGDDFVRMHREELDEIAWTLGVIEDWLLHTTDDVYAGLAAFAGNGPFTRPAHRHGRLIAGHCGDHVVTIRRRLRAHDPTT
jgi:hypothetical protein